MTLLLLLLDQLEYVGSLRQVRLNVRVLGLTKAYLLVHYIGMLEVFLQLLQALQTTIFDLANLVTVEMLPFLVVKFVVELLDLVKFCEVYESITHIALILDLKHRLLCNLLEDRRNHKSQNSSCRIVRASWLLCTCSECS